MADKELNARDAKLVQWLLEVHAKEAELEADLTAHISLTQKDAYKKRLRAHLTETRDHKKRVEQRIRQLGGTLQSSSGRSIPGVPGAVGEVAGKALAAVKGQVGIARAAVSEQAETHVRNCTEELREEHVEIALYTRVETLATEVGDKETAQLARSILRDEERMAKYLTAELKRLVKDVVRTEIPRGERAGASRRGGSARRSPAAGRTGSTRSTSGRSRSSSSGSGRSSASSNGASRSRTRSGSSSS
jgi:ferritin-like metal-binding protein YciE